MGVLRQLNPRKVFLILSDSFLMGGTVFFVMARHLVGIEGTEGVLREAAYTTAAVVFTIQLVMILNELYDWKISADTTERTYRFFVSAGASLLLLGLLYGVTRFLDIPGVHEFPRRPGEDPTGRTVFAVLTAFAFSYVWRAIFHWTFQRWLWGERVLVLGCGPRALSLLEDVRAHPGSGVEIVGFVRPPQDESAKELGPDAPPVHDHDEGIDLVAEELNAELVVIAPENRRGNLPLEGLLNCRMAGLAIEELLSVSERVTGRIPVDLLPSSFPVFETGFRLSPTHQLFKRALDITLGLVGLLLALPLIVLVALLIALDSPGPVFYRQERVGQRGQPFSLTKFRSMSIDAEKETGPVWAQRDDPRITKIGGFIRRTRLDEIPQLFDVLAGTMSMVGPRPERPHFVRDLAQQIPFYSQRHMVKPGVTGWAQVSAPYGASVEDAKRKLEYDLYYVKHLSVAFDLAILFQTVRVVLLRKGAL